MRTDPSMATYAAVDIGTNTVRLLIADVDPAGASVPQWRHRRATVVRLGEGVDRTGVLSNAAIERTVAALASYGNDLDRWERPAVRAVATSATRDAANRELFLDAAESALGTRPEVVPGIEEAGLSFAGATTGLDGTGRRVVIDPGGGSTEFVTGDQFPSTSVSVDIGSVRLTERMLPDQPATNDLVDAARHHVDDLLRREVHVPDGIGSVVGVAGTYTTLAAVHLDLPHYDPDLVHHTWLGIDDLTDLVRRFSQMTVAEIAAIPAVEPARAPVLLGGAIVAERAAAHLGVSGLLVSERDILDGVILDLASRSR